jgi:hypothetical protein
MNSMEHGRARAFLAWGGVRRGGLLAALTFCLFTAMAPAAWAQAPAAAPAAPTTVSPVELKDVKDINSGDPPDAPAPPRPHDVGPGLAHYGELVRRKAVRR